jgi:hypothetical protein
VTLAEERALIDEHTARFARLDPDDLDAVAANWTLGRCRKLLDGGDPAAAVAALDALAGWRADQDADDPR